MASLHTTNKGPALAHNGKDLQVAPGWLRQPRGGRFYDALEPDDHARRLRRVSRDEGGGPVRFVVEAMHVEQQLGVDAEGRARQTQEDAFFVGEHLLAVVDGAGGHEAAQWAARQTIGAVAFADEHNLGSGFALGEANGRVELYRVRHPDTRRPPMAAAAVVDLHRGLVSWAGDCRVYAVAPDGNGGHDLLQLTIDHGSPQLGIWAAVGLMGRDQTWSWETTTVPTWARRLVLISDGALKGEDPRAPFDPIRPVLPARPRDNATLLVVDVRAATVHGGQSADLGEPEADDPDEAEQHAANAAPLRSTNTPPLARSPWRFEPAPTAAAEVSP